MKVTCKNKIVASNVRLADSFWSRFIGLMGKKTIDSQEGLLLLRCASIHCFFMCIPIDAVYLSKDMTVLDVETLPPWSIGKHVKRAAHVLELSAGAAQGKVLAGEKLDID